MACVRFAYDRHHGIATVFFGIKYSWKLHTDVARQPRCLRDPPVMSIVNRRPVAPGKNSSDKVENVRSCSIRPPAPPHSTTFHRKRTSLPLQPSTTVVYSVQIVLFRWTKHTRVIIAMLRTLLRDTETQSRPTKLSKTFVRFCLELYGGKTYANVLQNNHNTHFQVGRSKLLASSHGETGRRPNHAARIDKPGSDGDDERRHPSGTGCWFGRVGTLAGCNISRMLFGESRKSSPA